MRLLSTAPRSLDGIEGIFIDVSVTHASRDGLSAGRKGAAAVRSIWNAEAAAGMTTLLEDFRPDVIHAHKLYPQVSVAPLVVAARAGVPIVQTLHDYELLSASGLDHTGGWRDRDETEFAYRLLNTVTFGIRRFVHTRLPRAYIAVSRFVADAYERRGIDSVVLPNFTEQEDAGESIGFDSRNGIAFVGRLVQAKGVADVLELAGRLNVRITVAGTGPMTPSVLKAAAVRPNLHYVGGLNRSEVTELLKSVRIALMPSHWAEPGALTALEAMAVGTPVLAYSTGGLGEYVSDSGGGYAISLGDVGALAKVGARLHEDEALWRRISAQGRNAIAANHSIERYVERLEDVYLKAVA